MSKVKRYRPTQSTAAAYMVEDECGEYVLASNHDTLVGQNGFLREKIAHLESMLDDTSLVPPMRLLLAEVEELRKQAAVVAAKLRDTATSKIRGANVHMVEVRPFVLYDLADALDTCGAAPNGDPHE